MSKTKIRKAKSTVNDRTSDHPLYPLSDGEPWKRNEKPDQRTLVKRQFLDAYFRINLAYAKLVALRKKWRARPPKAAEHTLLRKIEEALVARERLEDHHACRGVIATPVYQNGFTVSLLFSDAHAGQDRGRFVTSSSSLRLHFALPPGLRTKPCKN